MKIILLFLTCLFYFTSATDYCNKELCKEYVGGNSYIYPKHIACGNSGKFLAACPSNANILPMTTDLQTLILSVHNKFRNILAGGNLKGFKSAIKMPTLKWNAELSSLAEFNARQCEQEHDACHNTDSFPSSGQNLAITSYKGMEVTDVKNIEELIGSWWGENVNAVQSDLDIFVDVAEGEPEIGHFTAMSHEKTADVGCAVSRWQDASGFKTFYLVCNYGYTNMMDEPIYTSGKAGSGCKAVSKVYTSLCA